MKTRKLVTIAILSSIAIVLSILESFIPLGIPGVKLGLANALTLVALFLYSKKEAALILIIRIFLVGLIYSGILSISFFLSLSGGIFSLIIMLLIYNIKKESIYLFSIMGSIFHAIGEFLMALIYIKDSSIIYYLPLMITLSIPCGFITAFIASQALRIFKVEVFKPKPILITIMSIAFLLFLSTTILFISYKKHSDEASIISITYQNELITEISLSSPDKYKSYSESLIDVRNEGDSYLFIYNVYNNDEKDYFTLTVEVNDEKVRIKDETCKKHICSSRGYIKNKYESIICLPNSFIISINDMNVAEIDVLM